MYAFTFIRSPFQMNFVSHLISMKQRPCRVQSRQAFPIPSFISVWFSPARSLACPASCGCPNSHTFTTVEGVCVCVCVCVCLAATVLAGPLITTKIMMIHGEKWTHM